MFDLAICGMSCNLPQADNIDEFWNMLCRNEEGVIEVPKEKWDKDFYTSKKRDIPGKCISSRGGFVRDYKHFDTSFFKMTTKEAEMTDPQHREILRLSWEALDENEDYTTKPFATCQLN